MSEDGARQAAERSARASYGRLLSILAARSRDIAGAEDALSEAFAAALRCWPEDGVPANPDAWLITAARRTMLNTARHLGVHAVAAAEIERHYAGLSSEGATLLDKRLELLFVCAHPAVDAAMRAPLMLQTVLGLDAARIGAAFLVAPSTMGQRLVRLKARIRDTGLRFSAPDMDDMPERLGDVLAAIYAAFGASWDDVAGADSTVSGLAGEAIYLAGLIVDLMPDEPEPRGLLALMLYCEARRGARRDAQGRYVPLSRQNTHLWNWGMITKAEGLLTSAARHARFGRFQCEAAIQSVHSQRPIIGRTNFAALVALYDLLTERHPTLGALVGRAAMLADSGDPAAALVALDALPTERVATYQPYWAARAHCLKVLGHTRGHEEALVRAIDLTADEGIRAFLRASASSI
jgi:RNA polymerase sigma-70 factor, ECF subfamily